MATTVHPGYSLRFSGITTLAATRTPLLSQSNTAIARMANGFSVSAWLRFDSLDRDQRLYWIALSHSADVTWFTPFAGPHNGYIASTTPSPSVSTLGAMAL
eukprot:384116-Prymnesium_polylepis.1